jgi:hypothetical protein
VPLLEAADRGQPAEPAVRDGVALAAQPLGETDLAEATAVARGRSDDADSGCDELGVAGIQITDILCWLLAG